MDCDSERVWKIVDNQRHNVPRKKRAPGAPLSLFDRLYDCYVDCVQRQNDKNFDKRFCNTSNLLHQLPPGHVQPSLVVNLYSDDRGYSLVLNPDKEAEEICLLYEDDEIFSYLDNQEIPPVLTEVLSETSYCHMYGGCVVCEVRNHRNSAPCPTPSAPQSYDSHLLMLRPTSESILQMVNEITSDTDCSLEDQLALESKLLLATQPPICLDPSTEVVWVTNRLHYNRRKFHSPSMKWYLRRRSQARRARIHHSSLRPAPPELRLHNFLKATDTPLKCPRPQFTDVWKKKRRLPASISTSSVASISRRVQELASVLPQPPPTPTTPTADRTPSATTPLLHPRTGLSLAEEFLSSGAKHTPPPLTPVLTTPPHMTGVANMGMATAPPLTSPSLPPPPLTHKHPPTVIQTLPAQQTPNSLPTPTQPLPTPSLTVSLPRFLSSIGRATPTTHHNHHPPPTVSPPSFTHPLPPSFTHPLPPSSLSVINNTRKRPIPAISTPPVAMMPGKNPTPQHPTAVTRSSVGVIAIGNRRPETTTRVVGVAQGTVGQLTPPKLCRFSHLPALSASAQLHAPLVMPKLHRVTTPSFSSRGPASLAGSTSKFTPSMPILTPLSLENGHSSSAPKTPPKTLPKLRRF